MEGRTQLALSAFEGSAQGVARTYGSRVLELNVEVCGAPPPTRRPGLHSLLKPPPMRRILRRRRVHIHVNSRRSRRVTISVAVVIRAMRRHILTPRRLRELPYFCKIHSALRGARGTLRKR